MSFVIAAPEYVEAAASDLARIGSTLELGHREHRYRCVGLLQHRRPDHRSRPGHSRRDLGLAQHRHLYVGRSSHRFVSWLASRAAMAPVASQQGDLGVDSE